jgi:NAD-dependent DNA ligase
MGSLDKIRSRKALELWCKKFDLDDRFLITEKLDGISALTFTSEGSQKMYTRGNGVKCCDISGFLKIVAVPEITDPSIAVRGELIMKNAVFRDKFSSEYKNARNLVAGQFSSKRVTPHIVTAIDFVAHELIEINAPSQKSPDQQIAILKSFGFAVPSVRRVNLAFLRQPNLNSLLDYNLKNSEYASDGLVISLDAPYKRVTCGNPKHSISFKKEIDVASAIATVREVVWSPSSKNVWIPVVHIEPVKLSGVTISKITGHNAKFIVDNGISPGAKLVCVRSGDVIPHIVEVVERGIEPVTLPSDEWKGVNVIGGQNDLSDVKTIANLLCKLGVKNISIKTVEKLFNKCAVKSFFDVLSLSSDTLSKHFQEKTLHKIISEITKLKSQQHAFTTLVGAAGVLGYGIGEKRVEMLMRIPNFARLKPSPQEILKIDGFSNITADLILQHYDNMTHFVDECKRRGLHLKEDSNDVDDKVAAKKTVCLSGFRDSTLYAKFNISPSVTKKCDALIVEDYSITGKYKQATKLNIPIILKDSLAFTRL